MKPTAQNLTLEHFKKAVESANDHIVITNPDGIIVYANASVERLTGYPLEEVIGQTPKIWGGIMPKEFYEHLWDTVKNKKLPYAGELTNRRKNGEQYTAELHISPVVDSNGELELFIAVERDITQRKLLDDSRKEFLSLASHQLRTPLSTLSWYSEILLSGDIGKLGTQQHQYALEIYAASQRMIRLVNDLLNLSRIEMGRLPVQPNKIALEPAIKEIIDDLQWDIKKHKVKLDIKYLKPDIELFCDQQILSIIIANLLSNAMKYSRPGGEVKFTLDSDKEFLNFKIVDAGIGIPESEKPKIFTKFFRANNAKLSVSDGTGLGLYIVKAFVVATGGTIDFSSSSKGTTFSVKLPIKMAATKI